VREYGVDLVSAGGCPDLPSVLIFGGGVVGARPRGGLWFEEKAGGVEDARGSAGAAESFGLRGGVRGRGAQGFPGLGETRGG